jgi:hypothetical protein
MKYILGCALLSFSLFGRAQVMKYTAVQFNCTRYENQPMDPPETKDLKGMPIEFNMDSAILYIHSPNIQVFHCDLRPFSVTEKDSVMMYKFHGTDAKGVKCTVTHELYESEKAEHLGSFWLEYPDKTYMYYVEKG